VRKAATAFVKLYFLKNDDDDRAAAYLQQQQQQFVESAKMFAMYETFLVIDSKYNNFFLQTSGLPTTMAS
jgi:hypothetical protein